MHVLTLGGADSAEVSVAFADRGSRDMLVVPWDYDPGCRTTFWSRTARWVEPDSTGFYVVYLRPRSAWIDGEPTFDAYAADLTPYPHGEFFRRGYRGTDALRAGASLTPQEYVGLSEALPVRSPRGELGDRSALRAWAERHPGLAQRHPAPVILRAALRERP